MSASSHTEMQLGRKSSFTDTKERKKNVYIFRSETDLKNRSCSGAV